jgi:Zn-dependent protease with chaperone function
MERADYLHLVHVSELDAQERPAWYRQHVMRFAALGFAYVVLALVVGIALLFLAWWLLTHRKIFPGIMSGLSGLTLVWITWRSLVVRLQPAQGVDITEKDAPELFKVLAKLCKKLKAPKIHRVTITDDYNAFITQQPRFGFFGKTTNTLGIGLPLAATISSQRLVAVLAHEYAHLRGGDGKSAAWIYRTRMAWERLADEAYERQDSDVFSFMTQRFVQWYAPRFTAKTFAAARQEEYTADRLSSKFCTPEVTREALLEIALLSSHMTEKFWRQYWQQAILYAEPQSKPYAWMCANQQSPPSPHEMQTALHVLKNQKTDTQDTHPATKERVKALGGTLSIPEPSVSKAVRLLGTAAHLAAQSFDKTWWSTQKNVWASTHRRAQQDIANIKELQTKLQHLQVDQLERLAQLIHRSHPGDETQSLYARILEKEPHYAGALWHMALHYLERGQIQALDYADVLIANHAHYGYGASQMALDVLDRQRYDEEIGKLRERYKGSLKKFEALEEACAQEQSNNPLEGAQSHGLNTYELEDLRFSAQHCPEIARLWLLRIKSNTFPWRKRFVAIVQVSAKHLNNQFNVDSLVQRLDLPGRVLGLDERWLDQIEPNKNKRPTMGEPLYSV